MRPDERDAALLLDMLVHARRATTYVAGITKDEFEADQMRRDAVERVISIIGEAASKLSPKLREEHPEVPWRAIIGQRHILVHDYGRIVSDTIGASRRCTSR